MTIRATRYFSALLCALGATAAVGWPGSAAWAQQLDSRALGDGIEAFEVRPNFYVLTGAGANIALQIGSDGAVLVNSGDPAHADRVVAAIKTLTNAPLRFLINTGSALDTVGGNAKVSASGKTIFANDDPLGVANSMGVGKGATIISSEEVAGRIGQDESRYPADTMPTDAFVLPRHYLYVNGEGIEMLRQDKANANGDAIIFFRRSDVVMAGDIIDMRRFPVIDLAAGGSINGQVAALNRLVELAIPSVPFVAHDAGTVVVPGHGRLLDQLDVVEYRDMITIVRDRVQALIKQGKSLKDVKAARPTQGFDARYGSDTGPWTTDMFVEAVYKSLAADAPKRR